MALLPLNVEKSETSCASIQLIVRRTEEQSTRKNLYVNFELDIFIYLQDFSISVNDMFAVDQSRYKDFQVLLQLTILDYSPVFLSWRELKHWGK